MTAAPANLAFVRSAPTAMTFALAGLARVAESSGLLDAITNTANAHAASNPLQQEARMCLQQALAAVTPQPDLVSQFVGYLRHAAEIDRALLDVARHFELSMIETLALRLAVAAEEDQLLGHILTQLQQPVAQGRPTVGLLARAFATHLPPGQGNGRSRSVQLLAQGNAAACGLLELLDPAVPLPERQLRVPLPTCMALANFYGSWPGTALLHTRDPIPLAGSAEEQATVFAGRLLRAPSPSPTLIIRCGDSAEARAAAECVALACERRAVLITTDQTAGLAPWLHLNGLLPVFQQQLAPGERKPLPTIPAHSGPVFVLAGFDGEFISDDRPIFDWRLTVPSAEERYQLWTQSGAEDSLARRLASEHRHTAGRIAILSARARERGETSATSGPVPLTFPAIRAAARSGEGISLAALAELVPDDVTDEALVVSPNLRRELESLADRCLLRDAVHTKLGPSMLARYRSAVRALLVGVSGTGKTLAASWLATRLGLPLYRVDISAITSKYIGETEKNLSQLLTRAEQSEVVLLFDEADSLFARRTEVKEANDRFANSQTNYLLQRMESYDGITLLTSNSRSRFDSAFTRRLDVVLEFPLPSPEERRVLWIAHLGANHNLSGSQLNMIAATAEMSGGQIRNAVLSAAIATRNTEPIACHHLLNGLTAEYRKEGRQLPDELRQLKPLEEPGPAS